MAETLNTLQLALLAQQAQDQRRLLAAEPIAVIGLGCRYPAGSDCADISSPEALWSYLLAGGCAVREVPGDRWAWQHYDNSSTGRTDGTRSRFGGFLEQVDQFDPTFFGITPREAKTIDPQQRLLLEVAQEALDRAGYGAGQLRGSRTGIYLGLCTSDYAWRQLRGGGDYENLDMYFATGASFAVAAGRLAYLLGLEGPAMAIDTACSSSLVAVDLAIRSLRDRSSNMALAGGVSLLLSPVNSLCFSRSGMLAADGRCKSFDAAADGYGRGEGCGVVVLKRLADALSAGDPIQAVLRGSGVNQDGASAGLTVPNGAAQEALMRHTLTEATLEPQQIDVLEAHGTGTPLGDPIELKALAQVYCSPQRQQPLLVGSVKANLGHLEGAAGITGLIKAVLMVQAGEVPPLLHLQQPTPQFAWQQWALQLARTRQPWPQQGRPRRVAVSSFGFSGTNAHVLVEQAPAEALLAWPAPRDGKQEWLLLAAHSEAALLALRDRYRSWLPGQPQSSWPAVALAARQALRPWPWRLAVQAGSPEQAAAALETHSTREVRPGAERLAVQLEESSSPELWQNWQRFGLHPTALVFAPKQRALADQLAGQPPQLRLIPLADASEELGRHGYGHAWPLRAPTETMLVQLWLEGHAVDWRPLEPGGAWRRAPIPVSCFIRQRYWIAEEGAAETIAQPAPALQLEQEPLWTALATDTTRSAARSARRVWLHDTANLAALAPLAAAGGGPAELIVCAALHEPPGPLDQAFWQRWLPLLQRLAALPYRVHWALGQRGTPMGEALAALARSWAREVGDRAGGLIWAGDGGEHLETLLAAEPRGGVEWRWQAGRIEQLSWQALAASVGPPAFALRQLLGGGEDLGASTILISGGMGALGLATARWLVSQGARHLTLVGRGQPDLGQRQALAALEQLGAEVVVRQVDVGDPAQVQALMAGLGRPLAAVVHAAGVIDDGLLTQQTPERCAAVTAAKAIGASALELASRRYPEALFLAYSSVAAVLGSPGQVAYGAANGYLDGLLQERRQAGLKGLAVHWGPWAGAGMAANSPPNLPRLEPDAALAALGAVLARGGALPSYASERATVMLAALEPVALSHPALPALRELAKRLPAIDAAAEAQAALETALIDLVAGLADCSAADLQPQSRLDALGFDSLMAVELATVVQAGLGVSPGLGALAGDPTISSLATHLLDLIRDPQAAVSGGINLADEALLPADLVERLLATPLEVPCRVVAGVPEQILFTGASGFLGAFLLADQLQRHPQLLVHCLIRAASAEQAGQRLRRNLQHYDLWQDSWEPRLVAVAGDLAQPRLGLDETTWQRLASQVGGVLHNGAQLSYVAPYGQLRGANVGGTVEVLRLAAQQRIPVEYISSTAVFEAAAYRGQALDETSDLAEWQGIHLGYSQTKWVSERLVWQAARLGLPVRIHRPPLIAGHSQTGAWHDNDFLHRLVRGCLALGVAPQLEMELDLVPVDYVTQAFGALAWAATPCGQADVLHLHHPQPVGWLTLLEGLIDRGAHLRPVPLGPWLNALAQQPANPLYPLQPFFQHRWGAEQLTYAELNQPGLKARPSCSHTLAALTPHGIRCPAFSELIGPYARVFLSHA